ncbi:hypothetical protein [Romboutsia lituseburensis]|uniref:hypothetical protein n=1 Tax=Romboutsia lituseburensis TaxID=1537 RepID=UPI00215AF144|nr:hypothetical protein [Romboutsia lituseburensis]MCR8746425.1 hypothetical protein [Romboutsia lituseburensis]
MKKLFNETNNKNKFSKVLKLYQQLLIDSNFRSKNIMLLVPNNATKLNYESKIHFEFSEELNVTTYISFVKKELIKFWPIITNKCNKIKKEVVSPTFISSSLTDYILNNKIKQKRNLEGYFEDLTCTNKNISMSISTNINKAALSLIDFNTIGEKIYLSKKNRDSIMKFSYSQMNEIINYYIDTLLQSAMLDNSLSIYLYNKYLLQNESYIEYLKLQIEYLVVESLESCSTAEVDFVNLVQGYSENTYLFFNKTRDYSVFNNIDMEYIQEKLINKYKEDMDIVKHSIEIEDLFSLDAKLELNDSSQLYGEMIDEVSNKIINLYEKGIDLNDIAIISPINNTILDYQITNKLKDNNIDVFNVKKDRKIIDYPYSNALLVATCIFYEYTQYIKEEEYISFIEILLNVNRVKAFKIYKNKEENEDLKELLDYIENKKAKVLKISEFLIQFYIDKMLNLKYGRENVNICKNIIHESEVFTDNISKLGLDYEKEKEQIFIEALKSSINDYYAVAELQQLSDSNQVVISTPYSYISYNMDRPIQIWVDIGSNAWNMKIEKDISNVIVLRKSFKENKIYTDIMEDQYKKYYLYNMVYNLLLGAKTVYAYKSEYTVNGYIQESILYSLILKMLDKGDK